MRLAHRPPLLTAAAVAVVAVLAGCAGGSTPGAGSAGDDGTLDLAFLGGISTPDPDTAYDGSELNLVNSAYEGLLGYVPGQADPELTGVLATAWEADEDNTEFTFTLRDGVTFHDGTPFTSAAVKASFDRRTEVGEGPAYMVAGVEKVTTPSDLEVVITLSEPNSAFLDLLASPFGPKMISPTAIEEHPVAEDGTDWFDTHDAGTGPYVYGAFDEGVSYELTAYDGYWGDAPGYPTVDFTVVSSMSTIKLQLASGELDGIVGYADSADFTSFEEDDSLTAYTFSSMQTPVLFVNPDSPDLSDDGTRLDLLSGIDFTALTEAALGDTAEATTEVFPKNLLDADLDQQVVQYDEGALADLAAGALADGTISIAYAASSPPAQALSDNLAAVLNTAGITAESVSYAQGTYYPALAEGADGPDITFFAGFPDTAHPDAWAYVFYTPDGGLDLFGAEVPGLADLLGEAVATGDDQLYAEAAQKVSASGYWYSVATSLGTAVFQPEVAGVDTAWNPVITGVLDLAALSPAA